MGRLWLRSPDHWRIVAVVLAFVQGILSYRYNLNYKRFKAEDGRVVCPHIVRGRCHMVRDAEHRAVSWVVLSCEFFSASVTAQQVLPFG
jgi:hypothetical protein